VATSEKTLTFNINLNPNTFSGQKSGLRMEEVDRGLHYMRNIIIENAAFIMAQKQERALLQSIESTFTGIVEKELSRMGREVNKLVIGIPDGRAKAKIGYEPRGALAIAGAQSKTMAGLLGSVTLAQGTGPWPARNSKYVADRRKKGGGKWFQVTGELGRYLKSGTAYTSAYGPIKVEYTRAKKGTPTPDIVGVTPISKGVGGRRSTVVTFGNVHVSVLGSITTDMLNDPSRRQPSPWKTGLFESFPTAIEVKLLNREETYRPFLEQFLSFYLTRAIPNAVFRRIEQVMNYTTVGTEKNVGSRKIGGAKYSASNLATLTQQLKPLTQG
jgi:hypothetical protein